MIYEDSSRFISKELLFQAIPEYDIYRKYLGYDFKLHKNYNSPFHGDRTPSFGMFVTKEGRLFFKDFGGAGYGGDVIKFVSLLFNITYSDAIQKIIHDFNYNDDIIFSTATQVQKPQSPKTFTCIQIIPNRNFHQDEIQYWNRYGIDISDLKRENIYSVKSLWISKMKILIGKSMVFAYLYKDGTNEYLKIYQPFEKWNKWYSNVPVKKIINLDKLEHKSNIVTLAKSKKCKMVLNKLITDIYEVQKEGQEVVPDELNEYFDKEYDFKYSFFDNDTPGIKAAESLMPKGFKPVSIPLKFFDQGIKDPSDFVAAFGYKELERFLCNNGFPLKSVVW